MSEIIFLFENTKEEMELLIKQQEALGYSKHKDTLFLDGVFRQVMVLKH